MSVRIFLPSDYYYLKKDIKIYGEINYKDRNLDYYIIIPNSNIYCENLQHLGYIQASETIPSSHIKTENYIHFVYNVILPNIYLKKLQINLKPINNINLFVYDAKIMFSLYYNLNKKNVTNYEDDANDGKDEHSLGNLLELLGKYGTNSTCGQWKKYISTFIETINFPAELMIQFFAKILKLQIIAWILGRTVLYEHYKEWSLIRENGNHKANMILDRTLGILVMILLLIFISHPSDYLMQISHVLIQNLRLLLCALKGSPIGLKLNVHLNNFLLDCFNYHIDLWVTFLDYIKPYVKQTFIPIALLGSMGLSYQLALLSDLFSIIGLHANCFYTYAGALYKVEMKCLKVLWKVVLGKRFNLLKNRVESHNYMNRQLYLATIFFTTLLFLFPTVLIYYIVFKTLRLCVCFINSIIQFLRRKILVFPLVSVIDWLLGHYFEMESLHLQCLSQSTMEPSQQGDANLVITVFRITVKSTTALYKVLTFGVE